MDQARLKNSAIRLQWFKNLWNRVRFQKLELVLVLFVIAVVLDVPLKELCQEPTEVKRPILMPLSVLPVRSMAVDDVETKLARGRLAVFVQLGQPRSKNGWVWRASGHINELSKEKIRGHWCLFELAPSNRPWHKCG
jgi:hypothetical protein